MKYCLEYQFYDADYFISNYESVDLDISYDYLIDEDINDVIEYVLTTKYGSNGYKYYCNCMKDTAEFKEGNEILEKWKMNKYDLFDFYHDSAFMEWLKTKYYNTAKEEAVQKFLEDYADELALIDEDCYL